jgi:hypothetical protein
MNLHPGWARLGPLGRGCVLNTEPTATLLLWAAAAAAASAHIHGDGLAKRPLPMYQSVLLRLADQLDGCLDLDCSSAHSLSNFA